MYDDFLLNNNLFEKNNNTSEISTKDVDLDSIFNDLTEDVANVNRYISEVTQKSKTNEVEEKELIEERQKLEKSKIDFDKYVKEAEEEIRKNKFQTEQYVTLQMEKLRNAEESFRENMSSSLSEFEIEKKTLEINKGKIEREREQFELYRTLEVKKISQEKEQLEQEKEEFEKYKEISLKKIELDNRNLEQNCIKFKEIMNQFNSNFKPILEEE